MVLFYRSLLLGHLLFQVILNDFVLISVFNFLALRLALILVGIIVDDFLPEFSVLFLGDLADTDFLIRVGAW